MTEQSQTADLPNWKPQKFRDGMFVGAGIMLLIGIIAPKVGWLIAFVVDHVK